MNLAPGQTFNVRADSVGTYDARGVIEGGVLEAGPGALLLTLTIDGDVYTLNLEGTIIRFEIGETGLTNGVIAGAITIDDLIRTVMSTTSSITEEFARIVITPRTDLRPEPQGGGCTHVSSTLIFEATTAVRGDTI